MKAASLLLLRIGTGVLLMLWGLMKIASPENAIGVSEKYYAGTVSAEALQMPWGAIQVIVGLLVVLGLFRKIAYPAQALMLVIGALTIWRHLLDPFGVYLFGEDGGANLLFFPSLTVAAATLAVWAFREFDTLSLDAKRGR
ncbi:MAG: DoxX family membrane protein [Pacificimonas sp.]|jgi:uncharacterized membrane protein YphA (DoxX/SURF4 family)|nr:DoxX family membrane protein [Pacificimonas sp.]